MCPAWIGCRSRATPLPVGQPRAAVLLERQGIHSTFRCAISERTARRCSS
jgi:hypothetical protein